MIRLSTIGIVILLAATAVGISNTNVAATATREVPTEIAYAGGSIDVVGSGQIVDVNGILVDESIADDLAALLTEAREDGIFLAGWGWRSHERQHELRRINGCPDGWVHRPGESLSDFAPSSQCRIPTARPGASMHETGLAVDFTCSGLPIAGTRCFVWLQENAARFGLYNLPSEPWHWSVNGR